MAARATKDSIQRQVEGPDFEAGLAIINGRLSDAKEAQSTASGRSSQAWGDVEKLGLNKRGAQAFVRVQSIDDEDDQQDYLRTFFALCKLEGIGIDVDMVDRAEGKESHPVPVKASTRLADQPTPPQATAEETARLADEGAPALKKPTADVATPKLDAKPKPSNVVGLDKARAHLNGKPVPDAMS